MAKKIVMRHGQGQSTHMRMELRHKRRNSEFAELISDDFVVDTRHMYLLIGVRTSCCLQSSNSIITAKIIIEGRRNSISMHIPNAEYFSSNDPFFHE